VRHKSAATHDLSSRLFVDAGGLMSYGPDEEESFQSVARYVDRILRGTKPGKLPVEQPTRFEFVMNPTVAGAQPFSDMRNSSDVSADETNPSGE
jgi:putative tryptophan/tyrosine transport system substrate-binding protein